MSSILLIVSLAFAQMEIKPFPRYESLDAKKVYQCVNYPVEYYQDLCGEHVEDNGYTGAKCAVEQINLCLRYINQPSFGYDPR
jgi:hypothetical protein